MTAAASPAVARAAEVARLRVALARELAGSQYAWHGIAPRYVGATWWQRTWIGRAVSALDHWFVLAGQVLERLWERLLRWIFGAPHAAPSSHGSIAGWGWALVLVACLVALVALWLGWRRGRRRPTAPAAIATPLPPPDLDTALPSDRAQEEWLRLCRELEAAGDYRRALRAAFLAALAALGAEQLITIRRDRTNLEYGREMRRRWRARSPAALAAAGAAATAIASPAALAAANAVDRPALFADVVGLFDRVWYGQLPVDRALLSAFVSQTRQAVGGTA